MRYHFTIVLSLLLASGLALAVNKAVELHPPSTTSAPIDAATPLKTQANLDEAFRADIEATLNVNPTISMAGAILQPSGEISFTSIPKPELQPIGTALRSEEPFPASTMRKAPAYSAKIVEGHYIAKDYVHEGDEINCIMQVAANADDPTMIHIHNFYGLEETIDAVIDVNTGALTILPQRIWQSDSYGDVYIFPISYVGDRVQYYPTQPVMGSIDANGVIRLGQWGAIVGQGENTGLMLAAIDNSEYFPSNATMTATKISDGEESDITYPLLVEQDSPAEMKIYNFGTTGVPVRARVASDGLVTISSQFIANMGLYGAFHCFPINVNTIDKTNPIEGLMADGKVVFGSWVAGSIMQDGLVALWLTNSTLTPTAGLTLTKPAATEFNFEGAGTASSPWLIKTAADLRALSEASRNNSFNGKFFRLDADINMASERGFEPIGSSKAAFNGTFDGNNHIISNLNIDAVGYHFQGLFGACFTNSTIKNLILRNCSLNGDGYYLGLVAGYSQGIIDNCRVQGSISGAGMCVGGIIGRSYGAVRKSSFSGSASAYGYVGGIVGYSYGEISSCHSDANVSLPLRLTNGAACVGGIAGLAQSYSTALEGKILDCRFSGTVTQASGYGFAGGISGYMYAVSVDRCLNTGSVSATSASGSDEQTGGIAGIVRDVYIDDCLNAGAISCASSSKGTGGLIGYITTVYSSIGGMLETIEVKNCYNSGQVLAKERTVHSGVFGTEFMMAEYPEKPSDTAFTNVYTDNQATGLRDDVYGRTTSFFTESIPQGFSQSIWKANNGMYSTLKIFEGSDDDLIAQAVTLFADGESTRMMKRTATLKAPAGVKWYVCQDGALTDISAGLMLEGGSLSLRGAYSNDTILASVSGQLSGRRYMINVVPKVFDGEGTAASPYLIKNKSDFMKLHDAVMHYDHEGDYFRQTTDVDFAYASDFSGVAAGNHLREFAGIFDGDNHRIKRLKVKSLVTGTSGNLLEGTYNYGGLFHIGTSTSVIRNVIIDESCSFDFYSQSAPVIGYTTGIVENCRNYANISSGVRQIAGIVGYLGEGGSIEGCYNAGTINASEEYVGGIVGQNMGCVSYSQNDGDITGAKYVGGVAGASAGSVRFAVNSATISGPEYVGGVIGSNSNGYGMGDVSDCVSTGLVVCTDATYGGVVGYSNGRGTVERNYFDASINNMDGCSSLSQGFTPLSTSELLAASTPEGFDKDAFAFSTSAYPSLKAFAEEMAGVAARSIFVRFEKGEKRTNVIRTTDLAADSRIAWTLKVKENFSIADGKLTIELPDADVVADTLTAVFDGGYTKVIPLKSIPAILAGSGSEESPFLIKSADDINLLASFMERSGMDYEGYVFRVENDIVYSDTTTFNPISRTGAQFQGTLDGNGKTISGFTFVDETSKTGKNIGLFGTLGSKGLIKNLTLDGDIKAYSYTGAFAGLLYGRIENCESKSRIDGKNGYSAGFVGRMYDGARIDNCVFSGVISPSYQTNFNYVGGFAGQVDDGAVIDSCVNKGTVGNFINTTGTTYTGQQYVGGIAALNLGIISNSRNEGTVQGRMHLGGIAGRMGKTGRVYDCVNTSDITAPGGGYVGGIAPQTAGSGASFILRSHNTGNLSGKGYVGGIIGAITNGMTVDSCYNTGKISGFGSTSYGVGGVIGQMAGSTAWPSSVSNSWNEGEIYNETQSTGGFAGKISANCTVTDCWNTGNVTVEKETEDQTSSGVGGFAGSFCATAERIWNSGDVVSNVPCAAGIFGTGAMPIAKVSHAVNFGNVTLSRVVPEKGYGAGGIWGGYGPSDIVDCYNYGTISAPDWAAGINAAMHSNGNGGSSVKRCYNAGKVVATTNTATQMANIAQISHYVDSSNPIDPTLMHTDSVYFDNEVCTIFEGDSIGKGLTRVELMTASLGNSFTYRPACLPTLAFMDSVAIASVYAAHILLNEGDSFENVNKSFLVGMMPRAVWTCSDNVSIDADGIAYVLSVGDGWVKVTSDDPNCDIEKSFELKFASSEVNGTFIDGREVKSREFYTTDGMRVAEPVAGRIYIVRTLFTDGTFATERAIYVK